MPRGTSRIDEAILQGRLWTPASLRPSAWFDADDISTITLNSNNVSQWNDKSGNGRHASQSEATNQPAYTPNGLKGRTVLTFGGNDFFSISSFIENRIISVMAVASSNNTLANHYIIDESNNNSYGGGLSLRFINTEVSSQVRFWGQDALPITDSPNTVPTGAASILGGVENTSERNTYLNGVASETVTPGTSSRSAANLRIGHSSLLGGFLDGTIAEIVLVSAAISKADRQRIEGYLSHKWGVAINADHPYALNPPLIGV